MMESLTNKLLQKIKQNNNTKDYLLNPELLSQKILGYIYYLKSLSEKEKFEEVKHSILCKILKNCQATCIELHYTFDSTVLGQLYEYFHWKFEMEYEDTLNKTLLNEINDKVYAIQLSNESYNEKSGALRYNSIYKQYNHIYNVFHYLKESLPDIQEEQLLSLCALIFIDIETMSEIRKYHFLSYQRMESLLHENEKWLSCLMVDAIYKKPKFVIQTQKLLNKPKAI